MVLGMEIASLSEILIPMDEYIESQFNKNHSKRSVINIRLISRILGMLLFFEAGLLFVCFCVSLLYQENDYVFFAYSIGVNVAAGGLFSAFGGKTEAQLTSRDAYCVVSLTWIFFTAFGMLPFYFSGYIPSITDAFFETMSGFTTTGATILNDIEALPHGLLFWRSLTQWIGGLGIVFFTIAFLPFFSGGGQQLFMSEATGVTHSKILPKVRDTARGIWMVYLVLTFAETVLLLIGGMNLFDAVCQSFTTTATGGFSTKQASISYWNSPYIEYVVAIFMILSGVNFSLYFMSLRGHFKTSYKDEELHWFLKSVGILTAIITIALIVKNGYAPELAFRKALFQVATAHTSCGFATDDYNLWPHFTWLLLIFAMIAGGCTGSTSGGVKNMRLIISWRSIKNQFKQILHPQAVLPVKVNGQVVPSRIVASVLAFILSYFACVFIGWVLLMFFGVGLTESLGTVVSSIGNVGPGLGKFGPVYSWAALPSAAKWVLSTLMLVGRLEIFGMLMLFYPGLWKSN
jgi:trk system potassium uptake protein TrkH